MKIAFVITNLRGGGAEKAVIKIADLLTRRGHLAELVLLEHLVEHAVPPRVALHALGPPGRVQHKGLVGRRLAARRLSRLVAQRGRDRPFDAIVSTLPYADEVAALAGLPRLWHRIANTLSAEIALLAEDHPRKALRRGARYRARYSRRNLVAVSDGVAEDLASRIGTTGANIAVIPNPFDFAAIRAAALAPEPALPHAPFAIHVGRYARQKRHDVLLDAWRRADPGMPLVLLAQPNEALRGLIRRLGLEDRVLLPGFQANPYPWIRSARLLVLSSDHEGLPNVIIESLACGTPVVSTDCPSGPREILAGPLARFLVPVGDAQRLGAAIAEALRAPPDLSSVDLARYSEDAVAAQWEALPARWREP